MMLASTSEAEVKLSNEVRFVLVFESTVEFLICFSTAISCHRGHAENSETVQRKTC